MSEIRQAFRKKGGYFCINTKRIRTMTRKTFPFFMAALLLAACSSVKPSFETATAITEVFGDGQQVTAVALHFNVPMDGTLLTPEQFSVVELVPPELRQHGREPLTETVRENRTVARVYTNTLAQMTSAPEAGPWVILELEKTYHYLPSFGGAPRGNQPQGERKGPQGRPQGGPQGGGPQHRAMPGKAEIVAAYQGVTSIAPFAAEVTFNGELVSAKGKKVAVPAEPVVSTETVNLIVDDFVQREYQDEATGIPMAYNLFIPKDYDPSVKYPLVLFMPDATVTGKETTRTLTQGIGATIWASPAEQAKHPSFVLAPDYTQQIINDNWETNEYLDATVNLIHKLCGEYSIDTDRMYTTGQSGGCMLSFAIDHYYPDLFAASLLMAGKWDNKRVSNFVNDKMWMLCGEGDLGALPSMTGICAELRKLGVKVSEAQWNGRVSAEEFDRLCKEMDAEGADIRFTHFIQYSVFPDDTHLDGMEHLQTWRLTYAIEGVRDWLFRQSK